MPAIVTATVLRWVVGGDGKTETVKYFDSTPISMFVADGANNADFSPIIAEYILKADQKDQSELLRAARDGLLQVTSVNRISVTPPGVPPMPERAKAT